MKPLTSVFRVKSTATTSKARDAAPSLHLERRSDPRIPVLSGELPGLLRIHGTSTFVEAGAVNVSVGGMCVWISAPVLPNGTLELVLEENGETIPLVVVYCRPSADLPGERWMCGLKLPSLRVENLVEVFLRKGCIVDSEHGA